MGPGAGRQNSSSVSVTAPASPIWRDYERAVGTLENVNMASVQPRELPEDVRGYEGIDAILWLNATGPVVGAGLGRGQAAGHPAVRPPGRATGGLPTGRNHQDRRVRGHASGVPSSRWRTRPIWNRSRPWPGPGNRARQRLESRHRLFQSGPPRRRRRARSSTGGSTGKRIRLPPISRRISCRGAYGLGAVTWVAQDLGDPAIVRQVKSNWPYVWDRVFDWKNLTYILRRRRRRTTWSPGPYPRL